VRAVPRSGPLREVARPVPPLWNCLEALAWIRWRDPVVVPYFSEPEAVGRWKASNVRPAHALSAPGLPELKPPTLVKNSKQQLDGALAQGRVQAFTIDGATVDCLPVAALHVSRITLQSTFIHRDRVLPVVFEADQVKGVWPARSSAVDVGLSDERIVNEWLRDLMNKSPQPRSTKDEFRRSAPRAIPKKAFDRLYRAAAREVNPEWSRPGPRRSLP
jgi:hypothetical protein